MSNKITHLLEHKGLYEPVDMGVEYMSILQFLTRETFSIDLYCTECKDQSVFVKCSQNYFNSSPSNMQNFIDNSIFEFKCSRDHNTKVSFTLHIDNNSIIKTGQYPSFIDVSMNIPNKYRDLLGNYYKEYKSALMLNSHGYNIGAYAHLRRIIEHLISDAAKQAVKDGAYSQSELDSARVSERIVSLKNYLPDFFVDNVPLYGIISKGIHELLEEECREFFPVLQAAIEITLDEEIERRNKAAKSKQVQNAIGKIAGIIGSKKP